MIYCERIGKHSAEPPRRATNGAAGYDLSWVPPDTSLETRIYPGEMLCLKTGWAIQVPQGYVGLVRDRSGMAMRGVTVRAGVIDCDYRGEVGIIVTNETENPVRIRAGERVAQLLIVPCVMSDMAEVADIGDTERGAAGFGSTGSGQVLHECSRDEAESIFDALKSRTGIYSE